MRKGLEFRNVDLWKDMPSGDIWRAFRRNIEARIEETFSPDRRNAVIDVRRPSLFDDSTGDRQARR